MRPGNLIAATLLAVSLALSGLGPGSPAAQAEDAPAAFKVQASAITVDVVVLDKDGRPVRGLSSKDFTVFEDGRQQAIVGFEARDTADGPAKVDAPPEAEPLIGASNEDPDEQPERVFALLIDDLGLSALVAEQVKRTLADWIGRQAQPRDELTIMTASGDVWWSDVIERGREDLLLALEQVRGKAFPQTSGEAMSAFEAYRIAVYEESTEGLIESSGRSRTADVSGTVVPGLQGNMFFVAGLHSSSTVERVTQRWLNAHVCPRCVDPSEMSMDCAEIRACRQRVQNRAREQYAASTRRAADLHDSVTRLARSLASASGRKAVLLVSEELLEDNSLDLSAQTIDACQRSNAALYFLGARGLTAGSLFSATTDVAARPQDVVAIGREEGFLAVAGGVALAEKTGGAAVISSNDLGAGMEQMASDSSAYYLLGYQPEEAPDGKWHTLAVKVARPGCGVRARKGYQATRPEDRARLAAEEAKSDRRGEEQGPAGKRLLAPALLAGSTRGGLPVRMAAYVQEPSRGEGETRVQVVLEIDNSRVTVDRSVTPWKATLDLTVMAASVSRPVSVPLDERLELSLDPEQVDSGWWLVPREIWLPAGVTQIRAFVRDTASGVAGLVTERLVVPDARQAYISTPMITDRTVPSSRPGEPPRLIPTAYRTFGQRPELFCQYEVFLYGGWNMPGVGELFARHSLQRLDGTVVASASPTPIEIADGRAVRRIALPLQDLEDGTYELAVTVQDHLAERMLGAHTAFRVERGDPAKTDERAPR